MGLYCMGLNVVHPAGALHWSAMRVKFRAQALPPVASVDYLAALPNWLGMMGNDELGDCLDAMFYHGDQARTMFATGSCRTEPDSQAPALYRAITGWDGVPGSPSDAGSDPATSFAWVEKNGLPLADGSNVELLASIEIDPRNTQDVMDAMDACLGLAVGISVPSSLERDMGNLLWDYVPGDEEIVGGHEIYVGKKLSSSPASPYGLCSWGQKNYQMTQAFWDHYVNQCTALIFADEATAASGKMPFSLTIDQIVSEMQTLRSGSTS